MEIIVKKGRKKIVINGDYYWRVGENALENILVTFAVWVVLALLTREMNTMAFFWLSTVIGLFVALISLVRYLEHRANGVMQMVFDLNEQVLTWGDEKVSLSKAKIAYTTAIYYAGKHGIDFEYAKVKIGSGKKVISFRILLKSLIQLKDAIDLPLKEEKGTLEVWE